MTSFLKKHLKFCTKIFHKILFAHTNLGLGMKMNDEGERRQEGGEADPDLSDFLKSQSE